MRGLAVGSLLRYTVAKEPEPLSQILAAWSASRPAIPTRRSAALLYYCRCKWRVLYGCIEVLVEIYLLRLSINTMISRSTFGVSAFGSPFETLQVVVVTTSYLGAIFVMVRGFDNINFAAGVEHQRRHISDNVLYRPRPGPPSNKGCFVRHANMDLP